MNKESKIAVVGSGAVGSFYGGMLHRAGFDVHFLMRRDLKHVQAHGLTIHNEKQVLHLDQIKAYGSTKEIGPCDLVIIALKATANEALEWLIPPLLKDSTLLLTLQNGLGNEDLLAKKFGNEKVLSGLSFISASRPSSGAVKVYKAGRLCFGNFDQGLSPRCEKIRQMLDESRIDCQSVENMAQERWKKLVWNVPFNGLSIAAGGLDCSQILANGPMLRLTRELMYEVIGAAKRLGHAITDDFADNQIERTLTLRPYRPSSLVDFENKQPVEIEAIWGEPYRRGSKAGASMPRVQMLYDLLQTLTRPRPSP